MVKVWVADISPLFSGEKYDACYAALPDWRKKKADSLKQEKARAQSVGVWTLWTQVCRKEGLPENVSYNLSHSGNYVMCAYSTRPGARVGCDLEMLGEFREKTARRFFLPGGVCVYLRRKGRREAEPVLPVLGAEGKLSESNQAGDGAGYPFISDRLGRGRASGACKETGRISGSLFLPGIYCEKNSCKDGGLHHGSGD